jgi:hypothetical protein
MSDALNRAKRCHYLAERGVAASHQLAPQHSIASHRLRTTVLRAAES